ncbi:hypothetical protein [Rhodococcus sp. EPR-157]|uniref:hypothetical protein n=1 Tax=Rhodococcus sp. EPR-157 TaxID=1813677 RepID=UPI0012E8BA71|nr:hypothetical protein [Rhodococcus sp. EPR-157]
MHARTGTGSSGVNVNLTVPLADLLKKPTNAENTNRHNATQRHTPPSPSDCDWPFWLDWTARALLAKPVLLVLGKRGIAGFQRLLAK